MNVLRMAAMPKKCGLSRSSIYGRMRDDADFPKPIRLGEGSNAIGFIEQEVDDWIARRMAERSNPVVAPADRPAIRQHEKIATATGGAK